MNKDAIKLIIKRTNGDMRKLLNILQSINMYVDGFDSNNKDKKKLLLMKIWLGKYYLVLQKKISKKF